MKMLYEMLTFTLNQEPEVVQGGYGKGCYTFMIFTKILCLVERLVVRLTEIAGTKSVIGILTNPLARKTTDEAMRLIDT
jgi:hypothetical protein